MTEAGSHPDRTGSPLNILIVDDSRMMRAMIKRVIHLSEVPLGKLYEAGNGEEALHVLRQHKIHVLLTDVNMPVMTGTELLRAIATGDTWREIVRVVVSTDGSLARRAELASLGVVHYLQKPFNPEAMRDVLGQVS